MSKRLALMTVLVFGLAVVFASCAGLQEPTAANFKDPKIAIETVEVPQYDGFWFYSKIKPTKGKPGAHGAPLPLAITLNITNPNSYPILLDGYKCTIAFEGFNMITVNGYETQWIPPGKTNQLRVSTMLTPFTAFLSLGVTGGFELKEKGVSPWDAIEKWWTNIPDMNFPITVHEGAFNFRANGVIKVIPFAATYQG